VVRTAATSLLLLAGFALPSGPASPASRLTVTGFQEEGAAARAVARSRAALAARDAAGLTAFLTALRSSLGEARSLSVDLSNGTTAAHFAESGYDLAAIGGAVDTVVLMGYDQHGPWEARPGPIGALWWQRAGLAVLRRVVPPSKIELGVAGYGYAWRAHSRPTLSDSQARALVASHHARARYIGALGEWTARLRDGSTLWWSDARSFRRRVALARSEHIQGLAVWSLGLADPLPAGA
jgi:spore germination protein